MRIIYEDKNISFNELKLLCDKRTLALKDIEQEITNEKYLVSFPYILELIEKALNNE